MHVADIIFLQKLAWWNFLLYQATNLAEDASLDSEVILLLPFIL